MLIGFRLVHRKWSKGESMEKAETLSRRQGVSKNLDKRPKILYDYMVMEESDLFD